MPVRHTTYSRTWTRGPKHWNKPGGKIVRGSHKGIITVISKDYKALAVSAAREAEEIVGRYTAETRAEAASRAPTSSGVLASSYEEHYETGFGMTIGRVINRVRYAYFVEFGFKHWRNGQRIAAQPALTPAFLRRIDAFIAEASKLI